MGARRIDTQKILVSQREFVFVYSVFLRFYCAWL